MPIIHACWPFKLTIIDLLYKEHAENRDGQGSTANGRRGHAEDGEGEGETVNQIDVTSSLSWCDLSSRIEQIILRYVGPQIRVFLYKDMLAQ